MMVKLLRIYKPSEIYELKRRANSSPGIVIFERTNTIRCNNCQWNVYDLMCSRYILKFKSNGKIKQTTLTRLCMNMNGNNVRKQKYTVKSIKRL